MTSINKELVIRDLIIKWYGKQPALASTGSVGFDVSFADIDEDNEKITLKAKSVQTIKLDARLVMPPNIWARLEVRSSWAKKGVILMGGVIDSDYRDDLLAILYNATDEDIQVGLEEKLVQLIFHHTLKPRIVFAGETSEATNVTLRDDEKKKKRKMEYDDTL